MIPIDITKIVERAISLTVKFDENQWFFQSEMSYM